MMIDAKQLRLVADLLAGVSEGQLRELAVEALRAAHRIRRGRQFSRHGDLGVHILPLLAQVQGTKLPPDAASASELFFHADTDAGLQPVADFLDWFVRAGFAIPLGAPPNKHPITYVLTRSGVQLLESNDAHPLLPGGVERVRERCPGLPDGVVDLLVDSRACLERDLIRPAITVMGVAYEVAVEHVIEALVAREMVPRKTLDEAAWKRIEAIRKKVDEILASTGERGTARRALDFAELLRERRNDAAHTRPRFGFEDRAEGEEFLVSAVRHLPALWSLRAP